MLLLFISLEAFLEEQLAYQDAKYPREVSDLSGWQPDETQIPLWTYCCTPHCCEPAERPPPTTESEVRCELRSRKRFVFCVQMLWPLSHLHILFFFLFQLLQAFYRQQDEIRGLREQLNHKDVSIQTQSHSQPSKKLSPKKKQKKNTTTAVSIIASLGSIKSKRHLGGLQ